MKKIISMTAGVIITGVILLISVAAPDSVKQILSSGGSVPVLQSGFIEQPDSAAQAALGKNAGASDSPIKASDTEDITPGGFVNAKVTRIIDGDTLEVEYKNEEYKVRLLCIDTPETVKKGVDVQPYGRQATEELIKMVLNKEVKLIFEKDIKDNYNRLLAYILLNNGTCVNAALVEQGLARVEIVRPNNMYKDYFNELQDNAIKVKIGLWSLPDKKRPFIRNDKGYYVPRYIDDDAA